MSRLSTLVFKVAKFVLASTLDGLTPAAFLNSF